MANYFSDPVARSRLAVPPEDDRGAAARYMLGIYGHQELSWSGLAAIRQLTALPLLLKGIIHPDDARLALEYGVDGIVVSNHGGRQIDGGVAAIDALADVCEVVKGQVPVLMDSGIRRAADIMKALALGASAVLLGRPYAYALGAAGEAGVLNLIQTLMAELDLQLALSGCASPAAVERSMIVRSQ
jgi:isopentenyl diphosphate isomerase/L-lactate dehydrogenase-like FMN-dependent dehydrogenase